MSLVHYFLFLGHGYSPGCPFSNTINWFMSDSIRIITATNSGNKHSDRLPLCAMYSLQEIFFSLMLCVPRWVTKIKSLLIHNFTTNLTLCIEIYLQNHMLDIHACFFSYNNFFISNLKLSLAFSIPLVVNMVTKCYECPLLSISARSACCVQVLQELGLWRQTTDNFFFKTLLGEVDSENSMSDEWVRWRKIKKNNIWK